MQTKYKDIITTHHQTDHPRGSDGSGNNAWQTSCYSLTCFLPIVTKLIEDAAGLTISDIFDIAGDAKFREMEERIIAELVATGPLILATGGGAIASHR